MLLNNPCAMPYPKALIIDLYIKNLIINKDTARCIGKELECIDE